MSTELTDEKILEIFRKSKGSPGTRLLGFELQSADIARGHAKASFQLDDKFSNPAGTVQGGFLVAALDEIMTVTAIIRSKLTILAPTLEVKASFIKTVKPGCIEAEGRIVRLGKAVAFIEGTLFGADGSPAVTATATSLIRPRP